MFQLGNEILINAGSLEVREGYNDQILHVRLRRTGFVRWSLVKNMSNDYLASPYVVCQCRLKVGVDISAFQCKYLRYTRIRIVVTAPPHLVL